MPTKRGIYGLSSGIGVVAVGSGTVVQQASNQLAKYVESRLKMQAHSICIMCRMTV